jgi:hypothetical protein
MAAHEIHTPGNAVPSLDGTELGGLLDDLAGIDEGIDLIRDGIRHIALKRLTADRTQTLCAALAGGADGTNLVAAFGLLIARLADADTNPGLRQLPLDQQKNARRAGEIACFALSAPDLAQTASETAAAIDGI